MHGEGPTHGCGGQGTRGAHPEHAVHVNDAGGIPIGDVRVEVLQVIEEVAHVGDGLCSLGAIRASLVRSPNPLWSLLMIAVAAPR